METCLSAHCHDDIKLPRVTFAGYWPNGASADRLAVVAGRADCWQLRLKYVPYPRAMLMARATIIATIAKDMVLSTPITSLTRFEYGIVSVGENAVAAVSETYA